MSLSAPPRFAPLAAYCGDRFDPSTECVAGDDCPGTIGTLAIIGISHAEFSEPDAGWIAVNEYPEYSRLNVPMPTCGRFLIGFGLYTTGGATLYPGESLPPEHLGANAWGDYSYFAMNNDGVTVGFTGYPKQMYLASGTVVVFAIDADNDQIRAFNGGTGEQFSDSRDETAGVYPAQTPHYAFIGGFASLYTKYAAFSLEGYTWLADMESA